MQRVKGGLAEGKLRTPQANYWGIRRKRSAEKTKDMDSWNPSVWSRLWNEMGVDRVWPCLQVVLGWGGGWGRWEGVDQRFSKERRCVEQRL